MDAPNSDPIPIPIDLFVSKKHEGHKNGDSCFVDSNGDTIYKVNRRSSSQSSSGNRVLRDAAGTPLISMHRDHKGSWQCYKGDGESKDLIFRVQRTKNTLTRTELEVFFVAENKEDSTPDLEVKGFPFRRACTIYKGNDIVAQTSLMYKLNQIFVKRDKFRLTIFPGSIDHALIVASVVIFLHG
ncbi:LURP1-related protein domain containing protein [Parasponia andersonii]|uniref:LURP1-related protein domain containing protein n=1 Tax=Parasponia andersonii TaxID=3476 RepID=A0A2P5AZ73_PARAD|nr:LURP1-related protein domain containing protein [Parasponia andersonii]